MNLTAPNLELDSPGDIVGEVGSESTTTDWDLRRGVQERRVERGERNRDAKHAAPKA